MSFRFNLLYCWFHRKFKSLYKKVAPLKTLLSTTTNIKVKMHVEEKTDKLGTQNIEICSKSVQNIIGLLLVVGLLKRIFID